MLMYNMLEYSQNNPVTLSDGKSFEYKTIVANTPERPGNEGDANRPPLPTLHIEVIIPLKYLSIFWRSLDLLLIL